MSDSEHSTVDLDISEEDYDFDNEEEFMEKYKDWVHTPYGFYPPDGEDSRLVKEARTGNLESVKEILGSCSSDQKVGTLNGARHWTEVQEKHGYDKSWEWFGDTALIAAARAGHVEVVKLLLLEGADVTLDSCPSDDNYETAEKAAENKRKELERIMDNIRSGNHYVYQHDILIDSETFVRDHLKKINDVKTILNFLNEAGKYWKKSSYSRSSYSKERATAFAENPNKPSNLGDLITAVTAVVVENGIDLQILEELSAKYSLILEKKREEVQRSRPQTNFKNSRNCVQNLEVFKSRLIRLGFRPQTSGNVSQATGYKCHGSNCDSLPAKACTHGCCARCCVGACPRHAAPMIARRFNPYTMH
eukprot:GFUD01029929.1.p1 GENE.GFUD01029929.1~~GFUD01029929.1.p1  ORF type:complete len:362 (-),score=68.48 GFUD01029929.1:61-1146(-)